MNRLQIRKLNEKEIEKIERLKDFFSVGTGAAAVRKLLNYFDVNKKKRPRKPL